MLNNVPNVACFRLPLSCRFYAIVKVSTVAAREVALHLPPYTASMIFDYQCSTLNKRQSWKIASASVIALASAPTGLTL